MANINKKLTQLLYLGGSPLLLASLPTEIKQQIRLIRQINGAGTGYVSFNPVSGVNSLTQVSTGGPQGHVTVEAMSNNPNFTLDSFESWTASTPANNIPIASSESPGSITLPTNELTLIGNASDVDGTISTYAWRQVTGPNNATGIPATTKDVLISGLVEGTYQFGFTAQDNTGALSNEVFVTVTVNASTQPLILTPVTADFTMNAGIAEDQGGGFTRHAAFAQLELLSDAQTFTLRAQANAPIYNHRYSNRGSWYGLPYRITRDGFT
jgi:hypothetical protein